MERFYFTFGCGTENRNNFVRVVAENWNVAREIMFEQHGKHWAFQYCEEDFIPQIGMYDLHELTTYYQHLNQSVGA